MPRGIHPERNPGGADRREDQRDRRRARRSTTGRRPEFLGGKQFGGADTLTVPTLRRRPLAPGSTCLGPATLQEKRGQVRYGVQQRERGGKREEEGVHGHNTTSTDGVGIGIEKEGREDITSTD
ncbi:hypothetical protein NDU88_003703 [Pleurodeles waltl]|uniref:Uncharacterized protein n=1 Tax=Pleurodeles waltl TaxID=8319 RepID=A0AAV7UGW9_PLEWA|nr:hypothetical protein NDU88_003703 [Pleurodeles waltl]